MLLCLATLCCAQPFATAPTSAIPGEEIWSPIGPSGIPLSNNDVISGQINALAVHPTDANTLYIGASEGGVWKTSNGGGTWTPLTDFYLVRTLPTGESRGTLSIGSIAIDPNRSDTVYAGTGEPNLACCFAGAGLGVFRSADGGQTWSPTGASFNRAGCANEAMSRSVVNRILVRPGSPNMIYAASNVGVFRYREDGSDCWIRFTQGLPTSGNAIDLAVDPFDETFYAAFWSQGIFRARNPEIAAWTKLTGGLPLSGFGRIALVFAGRAGVGFSRPSRRLYAGFDANRAYRLFHTADGGDAWTELPSPPNNGQLSFNNALAVGTYSSDEVYVGQVELQRATDGGRTGGMNNYRVDPPALGKSWVNLSCCLSDANPFRRGLDLHGDVHDIVFAPYGSFTPTTSQTQIMFVATDGGVSKGSIDFEGTVKWISLTRGLAIGQCGSLGLNPGNPLDAVCGFWHNGTALTNAASGQSIAISGGDGFNATIDAAALTTIYFNCNAGFNGNLCRAVKTPGGFAQQAIWNAPGGGRHWSDPYRPGHLLLLQGGLLFRTIAATTVSASGLLNGTNAWTLIEPPGKTGLTTTMAFRNWPAPVYFIGTDGGQIWQGSPEIGWEKLCECGAPVIGIAVDLFQKGARVYAVFQSDHSPGRIRRLSEQIDSSWVVENIDDAFAPALRVKAITSVAVKPVILDVINNTFTQSHLPVASRTTAQAGSMKETTLYVGTDQGVYRGHIGSAGVWSWSRAAGVPNVWVTDIKAHVSAQYSDTAGIVRASTYGRGMYELRRSEEIRLMEVHALRVDEDGAPPPLTVTIQVSSQREKTVKETPFQLAPVPDLEVTLAAPAEIRNDDGTLLFAGWVIDGRRDARKTIAIKADEIAKAVAYYELKDRARTPRAAPLYVSVSGTVKDLCVVGASHELTLSWKVAGGQPPVLTRASITYPDESTENGTLKPLSGSREIPVNFPAGGNARIRVTSEDSAKATSSADVVVSLKPCR
jgi:hypothetical protein